MGVRPQALMSPARARDHDMDADEDSHVHDFDALFRIDGTLNVSNH